MVGTVAATDLDTSGAFAQQRYYFLSGTTVSATSNDGRYAINATTGQITVNAALNFEAGQPSKAYTVIARDNAGAVGFNQAQSAVTIGIKDINEAPTSLNWSPLVTSVAERDRIAAGTTRPAIALGTLSVSDPDTAGTANASYTYSVTDTRFEIAGNTLRLKQDASFDFEAGASVSVSVTGKDQTGTPFTITQAIGMAVTDQDDILEGGAGNDSLLGQQGRDVITGNAGNDVISGLAGNDSLDGGDGNDQISGGDGDDTVLGQAGADRLEGGAGNDTLSGGAEDDLLFGGDGNDNLSGDAGADGERAAGTDSWRGFKKAGLADGEGKAGLSGGAGNDILNGGDGDDYLDGGAGADQLIGGAGFDGVDYSGSNAAVTVNLATGTASGGTAQGDTLSGIELVQGSAHDDTITGSENSDVIYGGDGNDAIFGRAGNDYLFGGAGNDIINAEAGDDMLDGGEGNDTLNGGIDNDVYVVTRLSGADTINNYDPSGDDIDVIGFNDKMGVINDADLWFEKVGDDLKITVIGTDSSINVTNWYLVTDANSRANHKIDFIIANTSYSKTINIEGLVNIMATKTKPTTTTQRDTLMADLTYKAKWATYWNTNDKPVLSAIAQQSTSEDAAKVVNVTATDDITPNALVDLSAQVISGTNIVTNAGITFGAADANGVRTMTINPVANASGTARIRVTAVDAGGVTSFQEFDIVVNGVADTPTITQFASAGGTSGPIGITLNLATSFPDNDGSEVQEVWITGVPAGITLSTGTYETLSATWKLSLAQLSGLKLLAPTGWSNDVTLTATGRASENGQTAISGAVQVTVSINAAPTSASFSGSVNENANNGTAVGTVVGVDPDGDALAYSMVDGVGGRFVVSSAGVVSVGNAALIDFETTTSHSITVRITDPRGEYIDRSFTIAVNNVNEANSLPLTYGFAVNENVALDTVVGSVAASDLDSADNAFGQQHYYFWDGSRAISTSSDGRYAINETTGQITTSAALNFEAGSTSVAYTVIARDNQGNAGYNEVQSTVKIGINDLNEQNSLPANYNFGVAENQGIGTGVGTVTASDVDTSGAFAAQRYYFWDGASASAFSWDGRYQINATSGLITSNQVFDFEAGLPNRSYTVLARDNQGSGGYTQSSTTVNIGITNQNETPNGPGSGTPSGGATVWSFFDESGLGSKPATPGAVVATFSMSDVDGTTPRLRLVSNPGNWFEIVGNQVRWAAGVSFDYETLRAQGYGIHDWNGDGRIDAHIANVYVDAFDGQYDSGETLLQVFISNVNERPNNLIVEASNIFSETLSGDTSHSQQLIARFVLSDPDGTVPQLVITGGNPHGWFQIVGGHVAFAPGVNFSADWLRATKGIHGQDSDFYYDTDGDGLKEIRVASLTLVARDASGADSNPFTYNVLIEDKNETPTWGANPFSFNLNENTGWYQFVGTIWGSDIDGPSSELRYVHANWDWYFDGNLGKQVSRTPDHRFVITYDGNVYVNGSQNINFEDGLRTLSYSTLIYDKAFGANHTHRYGTLNINIQDVNEPHVLNGASRSRNEGTYSPYPIINDANAYYDLRSIMLSDPENSAMTWTFADGSNTNGIWSIEGSTGRLYLTAGTVDYEEITKVYGWVDQYEYNDYGGYGGYGDYYYVGQSWQWTGARDTALATQHLSIKATDGTHTSVATFSASISDDNEGPSLGYKPRFIVRDDQRNGWLGRLFGYDPETGALASSYSIQMVSSEEQHISYGGSHDIDNYANPNVWVNWDGQLSFNNPGDGEWEGGIKWHPVYGRRMSYQLVYQMTVTMTDASGVSNTQPFEIIFLKHGVSGVLPIILDLDGDGVEMVDLENSQVRFDMNLDGTRDQTGWVGADDGLLVLDRNGNGIIDDAREISFAADDEQAVTDLEGLRFWDTNRNGFLDGGDRDFGRFQIWRDLNQNGISETNELFSLSALGIKSLNLTLNLTGDELVNDRNVLFATSQFHRTDGTTGLIGDVSFAFDPEDPMIAPPIVFDLDNDGAGLVSLGSSNTRFDMNGDGVADKTGWIESGDAFLALDRNGNGTIDNIDEISFVKDKAGAKTDLEGLAAFDSNGDGILNGDDARFVEFRAWVDSNGNGKTDAGELLSLAEAGIASISLTGTPTGETPTTGMNIVYNTGSFTRVGGETGRFLDAGLAFKPLSKLPEIEFQRSDWNGKYRNFTIGSNGSSARVTARHAQGVVDAAAGQIAPAAILSFNNRTIGMLSTILVDLDGDGLEARNAKRSNASFDMDADGIADDTGWVSGGDGMLVIDRDGDGAITHASELSFLSEKEDATSAWDGLLVLDNTRDGKIDVQDARFGELKIWTDRNGDGISQADELKSLTDMGITEIALRSTATNESTRPGNNMPLSTATFKWANGVTATIGNVALAFDPSSAVSKTEGAPVTPTVPTPDENAAALAASRLMQAMSAFGSGAGDDSLSSRWTERASAANDWLTAAA